MPHEAVVTAKRWVVLGAGGFIGTNLCRMLARNGVSVTGFGRRSSIEQLAIHDWIEGDFADTVALARVLSGADVVVHLLGGSNPALSNNDPAAELRRALDESLGLIAAALEAGIGRLVFVSSGGAVYGSQHTIPITEDAPTNPISAYGVAKLTMEKLLGLYHLTHGLDYKILRVANPYGPFQRPDRPQGVVATMLYRAMTGVPIEMWGDGSVVRDYLHIDDVCRALVQTGMSDCNDRVFNIGSGTGRSLRTVADDIARVLGRRLEIVHRPGRAADIPVNVLDIGRARAQLDWEPMVTWERGLADTATWLASLPGGAEPQRQA